MTAQASSHSRLVSASPVYYGWIVWMVALVGVICSAPGQSFSVSLFIDFFIEDFGLDRTTVSGLYGAGTFIASLSLTWVGRQLDRWGNRRMGTAIGAIFAVCAPAFFAHRRADYADVCLRWNPRIRARGANVGRLDSGRQLVPLSPWNDDGDAGIGVRAVSGCLRNPAARSFGNHGLAASICGAWRCCSRTRYSGFCIANARQAGTIRNDARLCFEQRPQE